MFCLSACSGTSYAMLKNALHWIPLKYSYLLIDMLKMLSFNAKTKENDIKIDCFHSFIRKEEVKADKSGFQKLCKSGCKNYNKKYSCPPFSPSFDDISSEYDGLFVLMFKCDLDQINSTEYNKVRIANVVMKSRIDRLMRNLESRFSTTFLSTGSCRLCRPCRCRLKLPCEHPDKRRYSLEAVGVDCDTLSRKLFNTGLLWYNKGKSPEYTCVICGLFCNASDVKNIQGWIENNFHNCGHFISL